MKYKITFVGCPTGQLYTAIKERVTRIVEAANEKEAALLAYETHEHIIGGADGVRVEALTDETCCNLSVGIASITHGKEHV